jgi:glycosyltransferase involved in cell wall biosynthesis
MTRPEKIRVLQLGSPTGLYGAERWILALVKHLDRARVESIVGIIKDDTEQGAPLCHEAEKLGFKTQLFEGHGKVNFKVVRQIHRFIVQENITILHTHFYKTDIIGYLATRGTNCKIVSTPHGWSKKADFKLWCYERLDRLVFPLLDAVVPLSEDLYIPLKNVPVLKNKLHLIRNGVDLSEIAETQTINPDLLKQKKMGNFILGYIGQLIPRKGIDTLIKALAAVEDHPWRLFLVGDGPQRQELENLAREKGVFERIHFTGFRQDRLNYLRGFDIIVLPSRLEGIPRCLMEAMGAGVPIIASNIPGCNDLVQDQRTGLLFQVENQTMLTAMIEKMMKSSDLRKYFAQNAMDYVESNYSATQMAREYLKMFETIITSEAQPA